MSGYLYVDKYIPSSFESVHFNFEVANKLKACASVVDLPHMIINGCEGSGRKTFALLYIKEKYRIEKIQIKHYIVEIKTGSKLIPLQILYSDYHYQIEPSVHGVYDRVIVQGFIKDILQTKPICNIPYNIIIINNADRLTVEAQQSLRRTLEKNMNNCRFIFIVNRESTLIDSLVSRCVQFRLSAPTETEIISVLKLICQQENIICQETQLKQIAQQSDRNLIKALHVLQQISLFHPRLLKVSSGINFGDINVNDKYIEEFSQRLIYTQKPQELVLLRERAYDLLVQCIDPIRVLKCIFFKVFIHLGNDDTKKHQLVNLLVKYENTLKQGSKPIYHIDAFAVSVVNLLNGFSVE